LFASYAASWSFLNATIDIPFPAVFWNPLRMSQALDIVVIEVSTLKH
jgi:hypothetical protein